MATIRTTYRYPVDLDKGTHEVTLRNPLMQSDALADEFRAVINRAGSPVSVAGMTVYAYLYNQAEQMTIALGGSVSGNEAAVVLDSECYKVPGWASLVIQIVEGDVRHTVLKVNLCITRTGTDTIFDPTGMVPTLQELLGQIAAMEQATAAAHAKIAEVDAKTNAAIEAANQATGAANAAIAALGADNAPAIIETQRGDLVTITDGAARPAVEVLTHIEPVQEGSGDPSPDNVRPIKGWDAVSLNGAGKNLVKIDDMHTSQNVSGRVDWVILPAGTYTLSVDITKYADDTATNTNAACTVMYTDGTRETFKTDTDTQNAERDGKTRRKQFTFTVRNDKEVSYITVWLMNYDSQDTRNAKAENVQIEYGSTATAYEPYQGQTLSAALPETMYGGTLDWQTGVLTVTHCKIFFDGETNGRKVDSTDRVGASYAYIKGRNLPQPQKYGGNGYGNKLTWVTITSAIAFSLPAELTGVTSEDSIETIVGKYNAVLKQWYDAGSPLEIVYEIETPQEIQLTPQQLSTLKGMNNVWSDAGETELTYVADTKMYIDQRISALLNA